MAKTVAHTVLGPTEFVDVFAVASDFVSARTSELNRLNVFPVPDGDTGTNMSLTLKSTVEALGGADGTYKGTSDLIARGSLMGARGNSGVILSQYLSGMASVLSEVEVLGGSEMARALASASRAAQNAVMKPVEGTILTVARDTATSVQQLQQGSASLDETLSLAVLAAEQSVSRTPELLDVLRQAGVVDAGGKGLHYFLRGLLAGVRGEDVAPSDYEDLMVQGHAGRLFEEDEYGYCTEFVVQGEGLNLNEIREHLSKIGDSLLAVGDESLVRVHLHTPDPGQALTSALTWGELNKIKIDNMQEQHRAIRAEADRSEPSQVPSGKIATVAVAVGEGFQQLFRSLGVDAIVIGGQSMNPSTLDFVQAIDSLPCDQVIVLVNNHNALLAARQAQAETKKKVDLIDTENMAEGVAALFGFDANGDLEVERDKMIGTVRDTRTAAITRAVRDASVDGLDVLKGQYIALENGEPTAAAEDLTSLVQVIISNLGGDRAELVTFYWGEELSQREEQLILETSSAIANRASVESFRGDQPHYLALISVE